MEGADHIRMFGERFVVKAQIHTLGGFSAHAARSGLQEWVLAIPGKPRVRLVHGEPQALEVMQGLLREQGMDVAIAEPGETVAL